MKKECTKCKRKFPDHLIQPYISSRRAPQEVCPICALALSNEQHGLNRTEFSGKIANHLLDEARAFIAKYGKEA